MKRSLLVLISASSLCLLAACGSGSPPPATHFSVTAPATATAGTTVSFTVTALDTSNRATTNYSGTAHVTSTDGQATLPANAMLTNGMGTFSATLKTAGSQTITATDTVTASITGTSNSINVSAGATSQFSVAAPTNATAGTALNFTVNALDAWNNVATNYSGTVHFTSTDGQAVLPANSTLTNGTGTFSVTLMTAGSQTITATDSVTAAITGTSNSIQVSAAASGFTATGSMLNARAAHTATLLNDGRVLVVGGKQSCATCGSQVSALASAELYDPATGEFTSTGSMSVPRVNHTATLLGNGQVLVAGGDNTNNTFYSSAELYDPARGVFTLIGNMMTTERSGHTATLLANGKVLLAGGEGADGGSLSLSTAEVFDPTTEEFTATGSMNVGRFFFTATLLNDGRVLVAGGTSVPSAELFDPTTNTFALTGSMTVQRSEFTATLLTSGAVLMAGGATPNGVVAETASAELFDPVTGTFAPTGAMPFACALHTATRLTSGKVLITGGINFDRAIVLSSAALFDPATGSFTPAGNMETERFEHSGTLLKSGEVLITGGITGASNFYNILATAELFP